MAFLTASPLGMRFRAVRDNEQRASLIGINVYYTRWIAFVISGLLAGVGGALFALFGRYASASYMFYHVSGEAVVWAIVGGIGSLLGPLVGTALLILFRELVSGLLGKLPDCGGRIRDSGGDVCTARDHRNFQRSRRSSRPAQGRRAGRVAKSRGSGMTGMDTALSIKGLTKRFGGLTTIDNIDIQFPKGILNAVIGPNGAGKTTLFNLVTGMVPATSGRVMFEGNDLIGRAPHEIVSRGLSRTLQIKSVFGGMSVMDNVRIAVFAHEEISSPFRPARGYRAANDRVEHILEDTGLDRLASSSAGALSYGDVALLEIALALANKPRLLLLDEPICGMSPSETERTVERIVRLAKTTDIILIEHDMEVVFAIADLITVMAQGQLLMQGAPNEVAGDSRVQEVYLGTPEDME